MRTNQRADAPGGVWPCEVPLQCAMLCPGRTAEQHRQNFHLYRHATGMKPGLKSIFSASSIYSWNVLKQEASAFSLSKEEMRSSMQI